MNWVRLILAYTSLLMRAATTMLVVSLAWISGVIGWTSLGKTAGLLCALLMLVGYGMDLEQTTLRVRLSQTRSELDRAARLYRKQRAARMRVEAERDYWRDRALGSRVLVPGDRRDPMCVQERRN